MWRGLCSRRISYLTQHGNHGNVTPCNHSNLSTLSTKPELVVFDKDGTLLHFERPWLAWCRRLKDRLSDHASVQIDSHVAQTLDGMGVNLAEDRIEVGMFAENSQTECRAHLSSAYSDALLALSNDVGATQSIIDGCREERDGAHPLMPIKPLFEGLKAVGMKIAIATADSSDGVQLFLEANNAQGLVDFVMSASDDMEPKPSKVSADALCSHFGIPPSSVVMVGDTPTDVMFGVNGGYGHIIGVLSGIGNKEQLLEAGAHTIIEDADELLSLLADRSLEGIKAPKMRLYKTALPITRGYHTASGGLGSSLFKRSGVSGGVRAMSTYSAESSHDYVIVGAGSAGCVLANRLSEDSANSVLSLEAGPKDTLLGSKLLAWKIHMPSALMYNLCDDKVNWYYHTTPQKNMNNRVLYWPRGKVWGGSSSLNAMVYIRGNALDYDRWESEGCEGWSYADCLPYFKKSTRHSLGEDDYKGGEGPVGVTRHDLNNKLYHAFIKAGQEAGYPYTDDLNGYQQEGFGPMDSTTWEGMRSSSSVGHIHDQLKRSNLSASTGCLVTRVVIEAGVAKGVEYRQGGQLKFARANKEVILSGGAINSPQLLMLSGVGPAQHLTQHGIEVHSDLAGVGQNLQDHLEVYIQQECTKPITLYKWQQPHNMVRIGAQWFLTRTGLCGSAHLEAGAFIRSRAGVSHPDIQYHFLPSQVVDHGRGKIEYEAFQAHVGPMRQVSRGYLELQSSDPTQHPLIEANYLNTQQDVWEMRQCVKLTREIFAQPAFDEFRGRELRPGPATASNEEIDSFIRQYSDSAYHPSCTCKMGQDEMAVVDSRAKVYGIDSLRVVDASIMPSVVSGNLNGPTLMLAEKVADIIKGVPALTPAIDVPVYRPATLETQR